MGYGRAKRQGVEERRDGVREIGGGQGRVAAGVAVTVAVGEAGRGLWRARRLAPGTRGVPWSDGS